MIKLFTASAVLVMMLAGLAGANPIAWGGDLAPWGDAFATDSYIYDLTPGLITVYIIHLAYGDGMTASQFSAPKPECFQATYLSDGGVFPVTIGNSQTGVAVGYGSCQTGAIHVLTINYFGQGLTGECCFYATAPDPNVPSGEIEAVNCSNELVFLDGGVGVINPDPSGCTNAVVPTTWGKVKSVFASE